MRPAPSLLRRLSRSRLLPRQVSPSSGVGERRSKARGVGLEFADHRPYQAGDDIRHLDLQIRARLGELHVRRHHESRQLPITIMVDGTASMAFGEPSKFEFALGLAEALAFVGLSHGDQVVGAVHAAGQLRLSPRFHGARRAPALFDWFEAQRPAGAGSMLQMVRQAWPSAPPPGMAILISDWWLADVDRDLGLLAQLGQEAVLVHVLSAEEADPRLLGTGDARLVDAESGEEIEMPLAASAVETYQRALRAFRDRLQTAAARNRGRIFAVSTRDDPSTILLRDWRIAGLIG